jgi:hypothetical protein
VRAPTAAPLAPGSQLSVQIVGVAEPGSALPATASPASSAIAGARIPAHVVGSLPNGQPVVETPLGTVSLNTQAELQPGTMLTLVFKTSARPFQGQHITPAGTAPQDGRTWPALEEAAAVLSQVDPAAFQQTALPIPKSDSQLGANLLFFLAAIRGGDLKGWLGDGPIRILQRNRPDLLQRLGDDFASLSRSADEAVSGDWRMVTLPFQNGAQIELVRLYTRRNREDEKNKSGKKPAGQRFVLDVNLSRLGHLQLDGLLKEKQFDLILRSDLPLPGTMRDDIRAIFRQSSEITGIKGGIAFQAAPPDFIIIERPRNAGDLPDLVV